jgi:DNA-binding beta-propeller fold protein YncE
MPHTLFRVASALTLVLTALNPAFAAPPPVESVELIVGSRSVDEGGQPNPPASPLKAPFGVDFDSAGTMFIVELEGGRVWERSAKGDLKVIAGDGSKSFAGDGGPADKAKFNGMHNVAISRAGRMFIADTWNNCVREIDMKSRRIRTLAGSPQAGFADGLGVLAKFDYVMCVTLNHDETQLLIADINNRRIRVLDLADGSVRTIAGNGQKGVPQDGALAATSPLVDPRAVAADSHGRVYVLERSGNALRRIDADGKIYTVAGTGEAGFADGPGSTAKLNGPKHLCVDSVDYVFIADDENAAIRRFNPNSGELSTVLGRGIGDKRLRLKHPHGVCIQGPDLYVIDTGNDRILRVVFVPVP